MFELIEAPIARFLKVPSEPDPPQGAPESVQIFRAAPAFYYYRLLGWSFKQASAFVGLVVGFFIIGMFPDDWYWAKGLELLGIGFFFLLLPFTFFLIALDYRYRWYVVTDRSLRIRDGLWTVQERTMTFSNLQNLAIRQGPVQRLFKIADLEVRTAGGGSSSSGSDDKSLGNNMHVGYFRGVANAGEIRDVVMARMRQVRAAGLGDPDEPAVVSAAPAAAAGDLGGGDAPALLEAAREVLSETRALRRELVASA